MNSHPNYPDSQEPADPGIAGFEALKAEAAASGISQDTQLDPGRFAAALESAPAPVTLSQLRELTSGVREALGLAEEMSAEFTRDVDAAPVDKIVAQLRAVVEKFPVVPGQPL